jgi:hypothetical protein
VREDSNTDHHAGEDASVDIPLDGDVLLFAGAKASISPDRLPPLVRRVQRHLAPRLDEFDRTYECVAREDDRLVFLVPTDFWTDLGDELGLERRESDALRRAHDQQLRRLGTQTGRRDEFVTALEIREAAVVGRP